MKRTLLREAPTLLNSIGVFWKGLPGTNTPAYFEDFLITDKKVYNIGHRCQCYKTFHGRNLQTFEIG